MRACPPFDSRLSHPESNCFAREKRRRAPIPASTLLYTNTSTRTPPRRNAGLIDRGASTAFSRLCPACQEAAHVRSDFACATLIGTANLRVDLDVGIAGHVRRALTGGFCAGFLLNERRAEARLASAEACDFLERSDITRQRLFLYFLWNVPKVRDGKDGGYGFVGRVQEHAECFTYRDRR